MAEMAWLLSRGYPQIATLKLVGDKHNLTTRQRTAVQRGVCSDAQLEERKGRELSEVGRDAILMIDTYNVLITTEAALSGGYLFEGRDGCVRDLSSVHGNYRRVEETTRAIKLLGEAVRRLGVKEVHWYIDSPVSNSGRLKTWLADYAEEVAADWNIELVQNPDQVLVDHPEAVAVTSDAWILDNCGSWLNLVKQTFESVVGYKWVKLWAD